MEKELLGQRYKLIEEIGRGGMAVVYKAKCTLLNRFVAVKILKGELSDDPDFLKRFTQEAQAAASLSHPNIVSVFDVGNYKENHYIVMEYIQGITLKEYVREKGSLSIDEALKIGKQVIAALAHAHKNDVVHRDIKPHNILIQKDNTAKVTDFGIARAISNSTITMSGDTIGSVHYFSPEQARGTVTDAKSDLYSFGTTLYEMITGKLVFEADTPIAVALKHIQDKPIQPIKINEKIPQRINKIVMKLLEKDPSDRFESADEVMQELDKFTKIYDKRTNDKIIKKDENKPENQEVKREDDYYLIKKTTKKNAKDLMTTFVSIVIAFAMIALFAYLVFNVVIPSLEEVDSNIEEIVIENYVGENIDDVTKKLDKYDIEIEKKEIYDEGTIKGSILDQNISAGSTLKEGGKIKLTVSLGPEYITIKDYTNMDYRKVESELEELGLDVETKAEYNDRVRNGFVFATDPKEGTKLRLNSQITIFRSLGKEIMYVIVPDMRGKTFEEALLLLEENNLILDTAENYNKEGYSDIVAYQSPANNIEVPEGSKVTLFMDKEKEEDEIEEKEDDETNLEDDENVRPDPQEDQEQTQDQTPTNDEEANEQNTTEDDENFVYFDEIITLEGEELEDEFELAIETRTSMEDLFTTNFNDKVKKDDLPFEFRIKVPKGGSTQVLIYVNGIYIKSIEKNSTEEN